MAGRKNGYIWHVGFHRWELLSSIPWYHCSEFKRDDADRSFIGFSIRTVCNWNKEHGWIFGSENQAKWTQQFHQKNSFQNPLRQNFRHIKCLSEYLNVNETHFHSVVFFIGECEFKTDMPSNVLNKGFKAHIESYRIPVLAEPDLNLIMDAIQRLKNDPSLTKANHLKSLDDRHNSSTVCPKCGGKLVERTARRGPNAGSKFLGSSSYPKCKFTRWWDDTLKTVAAARRLPHYIATDWHAP